MPAQPTIFVKKKDGTSVRMTMGEFGVYKNKTQNTNNITQKIESNLPMKEPEVVLPATSAPVKEIFVDEAMASESHKVHKVIKSDKPEKVDSRQWTDDDNKSPLSEEVVGARKQEVVKTVLPAGREDVFDAVIKKLKFPVSDELRPRLKSLIVSKVKDIRTDDQVSEYAIRPVANGGLGFTQAQVEELLNALHRGIKESDVKKEVIVERVDQGKISNVKFPMSNKIQNPNFQVPDNRLQVTGYRLQDGGEKPILQDIVAPVAEEKRGVSPTDEMATISLLEFRRLSPKPEESVKILLEKFENLKKESLLLYLRAVHGWRESPLYLQYQSIIATAVNRGAKVQPMLVGGKDSLTAEEFKAITELNRGINI